jgi:hypothetical protein
MISYKNFVKDEFAKRQQIAAGVAEEEIFFDEKSI